MPPNPPNNKILEILRVTQLNNTDQARKPSENTL